ALASNFADPKVGAASGELILHSDRRHGHGKSLGLYWRYEKAIRKAESRWRSSIGYTGAITAIRRSLFEPLPPDTLLDDLVMPLRLIAKRQRVLFDQRARAYDTVSPVPGREFARKVRTLAGVLQTCLNSQQLVGSLPASIWWQLVSHKLLRLFVPYLLIGAFGASLFIPRPVYRLALIAQTLLYGLGLAGLIFRRSLGRSRWCSVPATFLWLNTAAVVAALRYLTGQ